MPSQAPGSAGFAAPGARRRRDAQALRRLQPLRSAHSSDALPRPHRVRRRIASSASRRRGLFLSVSASRRQLEAQRASAPVCRPPDLDACVPWFRRRLPDERPEMGSTERPAGLDHAVAEATVASGSSAWSWARMPRRPTRSAAVRRCGAGGSRDGDPGSQRTAPSSRRCAPRRLERSPPEGCGGERAPRRRGRRCVSSPLNSYSVVASGSCLRNGRTPARGPPPSAPTEGEDQRSRVPPVAVTAPGVSSRPSVAVTTTSISWTFVRPRRDARLRARRDVRPNGATRAKDGSVRVARYRRAKSMRCRQRPRRFTPSRRRPRVVLARSSAGTTSLRTSARPLGFGSSSLQREREHAGAASAGLSPIASYHLSWRPPPRMALSSRGLQRRRRSLASFASMRAVSRRARATR